MSSPASNNEGELYVAHPADHRTNPLLHKLTPDQFKASVKFYEADQDLTNEERTEIADSLQVMIIKASLVGYASGVAGFFAPTLYNKFFNNNGGASTSHSPPPASAGSTNTFNPAKSYPSIETHTNASTFPPNAKAPGVIPPNRRFVSKPFFSFLVGLGTMLITNQFYSRYQFNTKVSTFNDQPESKPGKVWRAMDYHQASLFFLYYRRSATDPSFKIKDPRSSTEDKMHEVHYNPPARGHFTSAMGMGFSRHDQNNENGSNSSNEPSHWDKIRILNGFVAPEEKPQDPQKDTQEGFTVPSGGSPNEPNYNDSINIHDDSTAEPDRPSSSKWDAIRKSNK